MLSVFLPNSVINSISEEFRDDLPCLFRPKKEVINNWYSISDKREVRLIKYGREVSLEVVDHATNSSSSRTIRKSSVARRYINRIIAETYVWLCSNSKGPVLSAMLIDKELVCLNTAKTKNAEIWFLKEKETNKVFFKIMNTDTNEMHEFSKTSFDNAKIDLFKNGRLTVNFPSDDSSPTVFAHEIPRPTSQREIEPEPANQQDDPDREFFERRVNNLTVRISREGNNISSILYDERGLEISRRPIRISIPNTTAEQYLNNLRRKHIVVTEQGNPGFAALKFTRIDGNKTLKLLKYRDTVLWQLKDGDLNKTFQTPFSNGTMNTQRCSIRSFQKIRDAHRVSADRLASILANYKLVTEQFLSRDNPFYVWVEPNSVPSKIDNRYLVSRYRWNTAVVLETIGSGATIVCEGLNNGACPDLKDNDYFLNIYHLYDNNKVAIGRISSLRHTHRSEIFCRSAKKIGRMMEHMTRCFDRKVRSPFCCFGKDTILQKCRSEANRGDNCITWAKTCLEIADVHLGKSKLRHIATIPWLYTYWKGFYAWTKVNPKI